MRKYPEPQVDPPDIGWLRSIGLVMQVGLMVVIGAGIGVALGVYLTRQWGFGGAVMVLCICAGTGGGLVGAYRILAKEIDG